MDTAIKLLEDITMVPPGAKTLAALEGVKKRRMLSMDHVRVIDGHCAWCNQIPIRKRNQKYCSPSCKESAYFYCYPQTPAAKMFVFIQRQGCSCTICGECFEDQIAEKIRKLRKDWDRSMDSEYGGWMKGKITYHAVGYNTGDIWQVDHIIPLHKGGDGIGLENIQVVCKACHLRKTVYERSNG